MFIELVGQGVRAVSHGLLRMGQIIEELEEATGRAVWLSPEWILGGFEDIMDKSLIANTIEELRAIAAICYRGSIDRGMADMQRVIPDIAAIADGISNEDITGRLMEDALAPALYAMESRDATELADIISYELIAILEELE